MLCTSQQVFRILSCWNCTVQAVLLGAFLVGFSGCEAPPDRPRPWRDDPISLEVLQKLSPPTGEASSTQDLQQERVLAIHTDADPGSLAPTGPLSPWALRIVRNTVFQTLIRFSPDGTDYEGVIAKSWTAQPARREIRVQLDSDARFANGRPITALDVQFSLESAKGRGGSRSPWKLALVDLAAVEIVSSSQLRLKLHRENSYVLRALASVLIVPESVYRNVETGGTGKLVGSGPYTVAKNDKKGVVLRRRQDYWGALPYFEEVHFIRNRDSAKSVIAAKEGRIDILPALIPEHYPEQLEGRLANRVVPLQLNPPTFSYALLNTRQVPFENPNVRRALSRIIDRDSMIEAAGDLAKAVSGPVWEGGPANAPGPRVPERDNNEGERLLKLSGWLDEDGDGVRAKDGQRLMITVLASKQPSPDRDLVLSALRKAGFVLDLRVGDPAVLSNRLKEGDFDLAFASWTGEADRDISPLVASDGVFNYGGFESERVDYLLGRLRKAWNPGYRIPLAKDLGVLLHDAMPVVPLPAAAPQGFVAKTVKGLNVWNSWFYIPDLYREKAE